MSNIYKIKHKPTGLFYQGGFFNLSERGKVYTQKPCLKWISKEVHISARLKKKYNIMAVKDRYHYNRWYFECTPEDWEIIEV